jgi:alginate O-acetyltransferase complex protein AlgJ
MLYHYRRFWALLAALLLAVPLVSSVVAPTQVNLSADELRVLAPAPSFPHAWEDAMDLPPQIDSWLSDHFGLRSTLIHMYALLAQAVFRDGNDAVLMGRDGSMFLRIVDRDGSVDTVLQSGGFIRRDERVAETTSLLVAMKDVLAARGVPLVVASPPNTATIYGDYLPRWARGNGEPTELDLLLKALDARGVKTVDLRPALRAERVNGKVFHLHDTHWTARGAVAAFNAVAESTSHTDWRFDMASTLGPPVVVTGGDLARMVGVNDDVTESDQLLALPNGRRESLPSRLSQVPPNYSVTLHQPGPTILIIGDSFAHFLMPLLAQHAGRAIWMHHLLCGFDWKLVEELRPDEVWWMPTERYMLCYHGARPNGFPEAVPQHGL